MGIIIGIVILLVLIGVIASHIERGPTLKLLRPYFGLLLIAALVTGAGFVSGFLFSNLQNILFVAAKIIAVFTCLALCLHLIVITAKRWLS